MSASHFFNLLTDPQLLETLEALLPEHRERKYPPTLSLSMFLGQALSADGSCQKAVDEALVNRLLSGLGADSANTGGYCRARQRLPVEMVWVEPNRLKRTYQRQERKGEQREAWRRLGERLALLQSAAENENVIVGRFSQSV